MNSPRQPLYQRDPNAYPSLHMARYQFIRAYYGALRLLANCYFSAVNAVFSLLNAFRPVEHVQWANASQLLFMPGHRAAKLIRQGQAICICLFWVLALWRRLLLRAAVGRHKIGKWIDGTLIDGKFVNEKADPVIGKLLSVRVGNHFWKIRKA